jgi:hypothetical protein
MNPGTGQQTSTLDSEASEPNWEAGDSDKTKTRLRRLYSENNHFGIYLSGKARIFLAMASVMQI